MVNEFAIVYPNIEALYLRSSVDNLDVIRPDTECLSAINFKRLTSLGLEEFYFQGGSFLPMVILFTIDKLEKRVEKLLFAFFSSYRNVLDWRESIWTASFLI